MSVFQEVTVPGHGEDPTPEVLLTEITAWVRSTPLQSLVTHFGGTLPTDNLVAQLAYLDEFTASAWNFRRRVSDGPKERNQVDADAVSGPDEDLVVAAADALGLVRPRPTKYRDYDHVLMLGGLVRANLWRTAYAAHLLNNGVSAGNVAAISAYRDLAPNDTDPSLDEFKLLEAFGLPRRDYEWEVMEDGLRRAFDLPDFTVERLSDPSAEVAQRFRVASATAGGRRVSLIVAPALEPGRRANTADGYRYWADQVQHVKPGERILAVTTCIYVPYQHAVALQQLGLPFGCSVDTVGIDFSAIGDDPNPQRFRGANYLLEIRSALLAYRNLVTLLSGSSGDSGQ
jgi:hypothetical protein